jgi:hypothetical protein
LKASRSLLFHIPQGSKELKSAACKILLPTLANNQNLDWGILNVCLMQAVVEKKLYEQSVFFTRGIAALAYGSCDKTSHS